MAIDRHRLTQVMEKDAAGVVVRSSSYKYDVSDRRIAKTVDRDGVGNQVATTERYVYDGDHIALVFDGAGNQLQRFLYGTQVDQVLAQENANGDLLWALTDYQGSVRDVVDSQGTVLNHIVYDSFGNVKSETNAGVDFRFGYTGRELDNETGLYYYRARYYDSQTGQFIGQDPIGFGGGDANLYRYVFNSSINFTDPSGLLAIPLPPPVYVVVGGVVILCVLSGLCPNPFKPTPTLPPLSPEPDVEPVSPPMTPPSKEEPKKPNSDPEPVPLPSPGLNPQPNPNPNCEDDADDCKKKCEAKYPDLNLCGDLKNPLWNFGGFVLDSELEVQNEIADQRQRRDLGNQSPMFDKMNDDSLNIRSKAPYNKFKPDTKESLRHHDILAKNDQSKSLGSAISADCCEVVYGNAEKDKKFQIHNIKNEKGEKYTEWFIGSTLTYTYIAG